MHPSLTPRSIQRQVSGGGMRLLPPRKSSPYFNVGKPLTFRHLDNIRRQLASHLPVNDEPVLGHRSAAVLLPLCNVGGQSGILFEVRGKLRHHAGEVSFPGGKIDDTDDSALAAALRETHEEIGIPPNQVEVLGRFGPSTLSLGGLRVYPYVGFIHGKPLDLPRQSSGLDDVLPSISPEALSLSPTEVLHAFHQPFTNLVDERRLGYHAFRGQRPYYTVDVTDQVQGLDIIVAGYKGMDEVGPSDQPGRLDIWGLTGWYLHIFMRVMELYP